MQKVINQTLVHYQIINPQKKKTLLILPGWGQNSSHWLEFAKTLPSTYRYILLDLPGFGNSQYLPNNPSIPEYTKFLKNFINQLNLKKPILLGHSFGGQIAINLAVSYPNLLSQLILLSPAAVRNKSQRQKIKVKIYQQFKLIKKLLPKPIIKKILKKLTSTDYYHANPEQKEILKQITTQDLTSRLKNIKATTTIIWGEKDQEIPYHGKTLTDLIPNSILIVLYDTDHNPHLTKPQTLSDTLTKILKPV